MLNVRSLEVVFSAGTALERKALKAVDLSLSDGEFVTVMGANGSGKSTLFNAMSGDLRATAGSIELGGEEMIPLSVHQRSHRIGRMFQDPAVGSCGDLSIAENLALAERRGRRRGLVPPLFARRRQALREAIARLPVGLQSRLDTPMGLLSGGQRQTVSLLMATLSPLQLLLLDEPTAALDPGAEATVLALIESIARERALTVLMITHSAKQALALGTRTIVLEDGKIRYDYRGAERAALEPQRLIERFS